MCLEKWRPFHCVSALCRVKLGVVKADGIFHFQANGGLPLITFETGSFMRNGARTRTNKCHLAKMSSASSKLFPLVPLTRATLAELCPTRPGETRLGQAVKVMDDFGVFESLVEALRSKAASGYDSKAT